MSKFHEGLLNVPWDLNARLLEPGYEDWWLTNSISVPGVARIIKDSGTDSYDVSTIAMADPDANFPYGLDVSPP